MHMRPMFCAQFSGGKTEDAARINSLMRQPAINEPIQHTVEGYAVNT